MSKYLLLRGFNSYLNRVIKRYETLDEYMAAVEPGNYSIRENMNFNPGDGVSAQIVYNYTPYEMKEADYVIVADDNNTIIGRYFAMENVRQRNGQYSMTLKRDVVAEFKDNIINAPCFIEKATLSISSNFIFNSENMTYNQIKDGNEILLKDETGTAWIVGYVAAPQSEEADSRIWGQISHSPDVYYNGTITEYLNSIGANGVKKYASTTNVSFTVCAEGETLGKAYNTNYIVHMNNEVTSLYAGTGAQYYREKQSAANTRSAMRSAAISSDFAALVMNNLSIITGDTYISAKKYESILKLRNTVVKCGDMYYYLYIEETTNSTTSDYTVTESSIVNAMNSIRGAFKRGSGSTPQPNNITINSVQTIEVRARAVSGSYLAVETTITKNRMPLNDAPYCMFAIPYEGVSYKDKDGTIRTTNKEINLGMARAFAEKLTSSKCYDVQLLPYCPRRDLIKNGMIDLSNTDLSENYDYNYIKTSTQAQVAVTEGFILWCPKSDGTFQITQYIAVPSDAVNFKVENETTFYRLCSPNHASEFEFKPTMNGGVRYFDVDFCYKPYQPYIHVNPNFGRLYGTDTNDTRGLICAGDFCLPQTSDQYQSYVLNNKNYQESFNRQIDNMNVMHGYDRTEAIFNAAAGTLTGAASGAAGGGMVGGATGGMIGGVAGGVTSAAGGIADVVLGEKRFNETIDYTKDQFNFQLGNVKARPDTLGKVSAYNPNNKIFPFLEKYTCTDEEKEALRQKLYYNGMTVGVIGRIADYLQDEPSYIKGKIIRLSTGEDTHMNAEIQNEINSGVFI